MLEGLSESFYNIEVNEVDSMIGDIETGLERCGNDDYVGYEDINR